MRSRVDLHLHTTCSDGELTPEEIVGTASGLGLHTIAVTDHDTVACVPLAIQAARERGLNCIPGVEISCELAEGEAHILGYFVATEEGTPLSDMLARFRSARLGRARTMLDRLAELGMPLSWEEVGELARGESVGRPHIAQALVSRGYVDSIGEAFDRYLGRTGPAYVPRFKVEPEEAIDLVHEAGGVAVLAHPWGVVDLVRGLAAAGLDGLEAYYAGYTEEMSAQLADLAAHYGLVITGGTDYHGPRVSSGVEIGSVQVPESVVPALYERLRARRS